MQDYKQQYSNNSAYNYKNKTIYHGFKGEIKVTPLNSSISLEYKDIPAGKICSSFVNEAPVDKVRNYKVLINNKPVMYYRDYYNSKKKLFENLSKNDVNTLRETHCYNDNVNYTVDIRYIKIN